jgi:arylsulfatase A-like enzyme
MTDDQGWGDVSYNGLKQIQTPALDAMAASGIRFNRFYAAHPSCSPTRASVMTGRHPYRSEVYWPGMPLRLEEMTIAQADAEQLLFAEWLRQSNTAMTGSTGQMCGSYSKGLFVRCHS